jgi:hypothetical protein
LFFVFCFLLFAFSFDFSDCPVWLLIFVFLFYVLVFCSLYFSAHMYISSTVQRGWWDLNIQPCSPYISLYIASICQPEDGL